MNRREFLKGTLAGAFGAFLTWAGVVRGEEVGPALGAQDMEREVSGFIDWVNREIVPTWDEQVSDNVSWDYSPETGGAPVCDMACPSWDICLHYVDPNDRPCYRNETGNAQATDLYWCHQGCDGCPHEDCEAYPQGVPMSVTADLTASTSSSGEGIDIPDWRPTGTTWFVDETNGDDSNDGLALEAALLTRQEALSRCKASSDVVVFSGWGVIGTNSGQWVYWDKDHGSDEDGTGAWDDPVATEACARSIADNPHRRITAEMLTYDGIDSALLMQNGSAFVSDDMGATWREMDPAQVQEWATGRKDFPWT